MPRGRRISLSFHRVANPRSNFRSNPRSGERGYILLTLVFFVAVIAIAAATALPSILQEIRRDREEEMIHRGVQYSRAIRAYYKKLGRYPVKIEDLESTNNLRFLRRRYKDPITGKDFKLLHLGDVKISFNNGINPQRQPGINDPTVPPGGPDRAPGSLQPPSGLNPDQQRNPNDPNPSPDSAGAPTEDANGNPVAKSDSNSDNPGPGGGATFGGGAIVGVVSTSRMETIREFNKKHRYNQWQFIYDPGTDRGGLLNTPAQPQLQGGEGNCQVPPVQPGTAGQSVVQPPPDGGSNPAPTGDSQN